MTESIHLVIILSVAIVTIITGVTTEVVCPDYIPNGVLIYNCTRRINRDIYVSGINETCLYGCDIGYTFNQSLPDTGNNITCTDSGAWNVNTSDLCFRVTCPDYIENGNLNADCARYGGEACTYSCKEGYVPNPYMNQYINCSTDGNWNINTSTLCLEIICHRSLENGHFGSNCLGYEDAVCGYSCLDGYTVNKSHTSVTCTADGTWDVDTSTLCLEEFCPVDLPMGMIEGECDRHLGSTCRFVCDKKDENKTVPYRLTCQKHGRWSPDVKLICADKRKTIDHHALPSGATIGIALGVTGVVLVNIGCLVLYFIKRARKKRLRRDINSPQQKVTFKQEKTNQNTKSFSTVTINDTQENDRAKIIRF